MQFWENEDDSRYGRKVLRMKKDGETRVIVVIPEADDTITFVDGCDEWFSINLTKQQALEAIDELRTWIESK